MQALWNLYEVADCGKGMGGERRLAEKVPPHATAMHRVATVQTFEIKVQLIEALTIGRVSISALSALAAGLVRKHNMISGSYTIDLVADLFYKARSLMSQHDRDLCRVPVVHYVYVRVTDP
jgi:hypothetical protein